MEMHLVYLVQAGDTIKIAVLWFHTSVMDCEPKNSRPNTKLHTKTHTTHCTHNLVKPVSGHLSK